jgi:ferredoxin--NADP+ reductase
VSVGSKTRFVCVDGPEFDGHEVDFDELSRRQALYHEQEKASFEHLQRENT